MRVWSERRATRSPSRLATGGTARSDASATERRVRKEGVASEGVVQSRIDQHARARRDDRRRASVSSRARLRSPRRRRRRLPPRLRGGVDREKYRYSLGDASFVEMHHPRMQPISAAGAESRCPGGVPHARHTTRARERRPPRASGPRRRRRVARLRRSLASLARRAHPSVRDRRAVRPRGRVLGIKRTSAPRRKLGLRSARRERDREHRHRYAAHRLVQLCRLDGLRAR